MQLQVERVRAVDLDKSGKMVNLYRSAMNGTDIAIDNCIKFIVIIDFCSTKSFMISYNVAMTFTETANNFIASLIAF